jgi:hypothetical protein
MKLSSLIAPACLLGTAASIDMSKYSAGPGVESGFKSFVQAYATYILASSQSNGGTQLTFLGSTHLPRIQL